MSIETQQHQQTQERLERVTIENMALKANLQEAIDIIKELQQWTRPFAQLPLPQSDDAQSAAATPTKDAVTPDIKGAKRKAATSVEGQPRQGKAARRLTSTFGDSARAGQVDFLLSLLEMASSVQDFRDKACSTDAEITVDGDFKTLIDNVYAKCGQDLIKENMYKLIRTLDVFLTMRDEGIAEFKEDGCIILFPFSSIEVEQRQLWDDYMSKLAQDFVRKYNKQDKTIKEPISTVYEIFNMSGFRCKLSKNSKFRHYSQLGREPPGQYEKKSLKQDYYVTDAQYFGEKKIQRATKGR